ncbi:hypothetical protein ES708_26436 [subsurface metagenome]
MAVVIPSALVQGLRGSVGAQSFQYWRKGVYTVKSKATIVNQPDTISQGQTRARLGVAVASWKALLTQDQRNAWNSFAKLPRFVDSKAGGMLAVIRGSKNTGAGYHKYIELNMMKASADIAPQAVIRDPPFEERLPDTPADFAAVWHLPAANHVDITWTDPDTYPMGSRIRIWLKSPDAIYHTQQVFTGPVVTGMTIETSGKTVGGAIKLFTTLPDGSNLYFQAEIISPNGQPSVPTNTEIVVIS